MNELFYNIKNIMQDKKISNNDLIERTNLNQSTVYHIMKNEENFKNAKFINIYTILFAIYKIVGEETWDLYMEK